MISSTDYLAALPPAVADQLAALVRRIGGLSTTEKAEASRLLIASMKEWRGAGGAEEPCIVLAQTTEVLHAIWGESLTTEVPRD